VVRNYFAVGAVGTVGAVVRLWLGIILLWELWLRDVSVGAVGAVVTTRLPRLGCGQE
jgi:hypothetical protein